ncbi:unnamed protein product [Symbiodinium pilosum]|uniref:Glycosyltransferase 2-like domain-containing protein n=1 Tax=Symbiodinium pilosum TaxID=2952 RepID=A0A812INC8_SYMPI|nr:unnamed protein product [Symbiodinium pilosum]
MDMPEGWKEGSPVSFSIGDQDVWAEFGIEAPASWSLGLKRNVAIQLAQGEVVAHFDDDDLYASGYLSWMHHRLEKVRKKAEKDLCTSTKKESRLCPVAITLREWHLLDLSDMTFGFMDVEKDPLIPRDQRHGWLYGWGFSYMFTKSCWDLVPVPDVEWSEDISFYEDLRRLKVPVVAVPLPPGREALCRCTQLSRKGEHQRGRAQHPDEQNEEMDIGTDALVLGSPALFAVASQLVSSFGLNLGTEILALLWPPWHSLEEATGEKQGFRVSLSEKKEFMQCRGQAWHGFAGVQLKLSEAISHQARSVATWPAPRPFQPQ